MGFLKLIRFLFLHGSLFWKHRNSLMEAVEKKGDKLFEQQQLDAFVSNMDIMKNGIHLMPDDIIPYAEELLFRISECNDCYKAGKCKDCGCALPDRMLEPSQYCSSGKWPAMDKESWKEYKEATGIEIKVVRK